MQKDDHIVSAKEVKSLRYQTPYFLLSSNELIKSLNSYRQNFPNADIYYAMKANAESDVLKTLNDNGAGFEVASSYELNMLKRIGVHPDKIICGTAVKSAKQIKFFHNYGVDRFAFDSKQEVDKLAKVAPGCRVYARVLVNDQANSVFTMSEKFGIAKNKIEDLLGYAKLKGLRVYGLSFNVGSQARNPKAWANAIEDMIPLIKSLKEQGITLEVLNLGGGWPYKYRDEDKISLLGEIAKYTKHAITKLPYDMKIFLEPGRGIIAHPMALVVRVIAKIKRPNGYWLYVDGGAYNALLETMSYQGSTRYEIISLISNPKPSQKFILTGPTGDSLDVIDSAVSLPDNIKIGDKIIIYDTGAYSLTLTTPFNGFPKPKVHTI